MDGGQGTFIGKSKCAQRVPRVSAGLRACQEGMQRPPKKSDGVSGRLKRVPCDFRGLKGASGSFREYQKIPGVFKGDFRRF